MEIDMMQAVAAVIGLLGVILTSVAVPLIKSKMNDSQWELIGKYALAAVQAAEILFNGTREGQKNLIMQQSISKANVWPMVSKLMWPQCA